MIFRKIFFTVALLGSLLINSCDSSVDSSIEGKGIYFNTYSSSSAGVMEYYYINADGTGKRQIPLGVTIGLISNVSGNKKKMIIHAREGVFAINTDGTNAVKLPISGFGSSRLTADGQLLIYTTESGIYKIRTDGTGKQLIYTSSENIIGFAISQDGQNIIFVEAKNQNSTGAASLNSIQSDGTGKKTILLWDPVKFLSFGFVPNSNKIAFSTQNDTTGFALWVMNTDGSELKNLFSHRYIEQNIGSYSADGTKLLVVQHDENMDMDIYEVAVDGSGSKVLANDPKLNEVPRGWSQDGTMFLYSAYTQQSSELYIMNTNGSNKRKLNTGVDVAGWAFWSE